MMTKPLVTIIDEEVAKKVIGWAKAGRGIRLWKSHDLGAGRPDMFTPGDAGSPHWAYPAYTDITLSDIEYDGRDVLALPVEWFPKCKGCKGTGKRSYDDLRAARKSEETNEELAKLCNIVEVDADHFRCTYCRGVKHEVTPFQIKVERRYWGGYEPTGGVKWGDGTWTPPNKVAALLPRLAKHYDIPESEIKWDWGFPEYRNMAPVMFYTSKLICLADSDLAK